MSKHTPGPWKAVFSGVAAQIDCMEIAEVSHMRVIPASGGWPTPGEPEVDARLIAAAPELLEALINANARMCDLPPTDPIIAQVRAAIAKATGEQQP